DQECLSLLLLNIARFKDVNDTFGHHEVDRLLHQIAERVSRLVATTDTVARIGDDEFSILLPTADEADARAIASIIVQSFDEPFLIAEQSLQLQVDVGL